MANYPQEFFQDAAYQSHTSRLTELWSLPRPAQGLNTCFTEFFNHFRNSAFYWRLPSKLKKKKKENFVYSGRKTSFLHNFPK